MNSLIAKKNQSLDKKIIKAQTEYNTQYNTTESLKSLIRNSKPVDAVQYGDSLLQSLSTQSELLTKLNNLKDKKDKINPKSGLDNNK